MKKNVLNNVELKKITSLNHKIDDFFEKDSPTILLDFSSVFDYVGKINNLWEEINKTSKIEYNIDVERNSTDVEYQKFDEFLKSTNTERIKEIKSNLHIIEGCSIINDLITSKN